MKRHAKDFDPSTRVVENFRYMQALGRIQDLESANAELVEALKHFVKRVEEGSIRSKRTYAQFKKMIDKYEAKND